MEPCYVGLEFNLIPLSLEDELLLYHDSACNGEGEEGLDSWKQNNSFSIDTRSLDFVDVIRRFPTPDPMLKAPISYSSESSPSIGTVSKAFERDTENLSTLALRPPNNVTMRGRFCAVLHDGNYVLQVIYEQVFLEQSLHSQNFSDAFRDYLINWLDELATSRGVKIVAIGIVNNKSPFRSDGSVEEFEESLDRIKLMPGFVGRLWHDLDIIPCLFQVESGTGCTSDQRAESAVRKCLSLFGPSSALPLPRINVGYYNRVEVDSECIKIAELKDYENSCPALVWSTLLKLVRENRNLKVSFFSSTPQGGGVALMRHSLIRMAKLLHLPWNWYVVRPSAQVFHITKKKFHNILQGITPGCDGSTDCAANVELTPAEKSIYERWCKENAISYWQNSIFPESDVIVLDDPQVLGLVPWILSCHRRKPNSKLFYRSHIQIASDLISLDGTNAITKVWNYLFDTFISQVDFIITHPREEFFPVHSAECFGRDRIFFMPATTDPLDGLNKELRHDNSRAYYANIIRRLCLEQRKNGMNALELKSLEELVARLMGSATERGYIVQIARFDPSKGIKDVIDAYCHYRETYCQIDKSVPPPQLLICGHGSIDDPEGMPIYEESINYVRERAPHFRADIHIILVPPSDQLLNLVLGQADLALQLSKREGFEIKVTEALKKGIPVIAYDAGGIGLQKSAVTGSPLLHLVPVGNIEAVSRAIHEQLQSSIKKRNESRRDSCSPAPEFETPFQVVNWLTLFSLSQSNQLPLLAGHVDTSSSNSRWVKSLWYQQK